MAAYTNNYITTFSIAPTLKLIGNSVVIGCLEVISEALTLGEKAGIDVFAIVGVLKGEPPIPYA